MKVLKDNNACFAKLHCSAGLSALNRLKPAAPVCTSTCVSTSPSLAFLKNPRARRSASGASFTARAFSACSLEALLATSPEKSSTMPAPGAASKKVAKSELPM
eukprot:CAMPEP_0115347706 /NCGR_PEP_ID=MMETSP0270-20121206/95022_1 /TAXON_ID=71861 /ORGANISM="Scrippsiella trochoidea, Strain CCMP3099" /LENGTH=102 /DNA_ID=CAMNT_0002769643 /DNA_START=317 /DNA_END=626 /DNA_ORIENTATION=-